MFIVFTIESEEFKNMLGSSLSLLKAEICLKNSSQNFRNKYRLVFYWYKGHSRFDSLFYVIESNVLIFLLVVLFWGEEELKCFQYLFMNVSAKGIYDILTLHGVVFF